MTKKTRTIGLFALAIVSTAALASRMTGAPQQQPDPQPRIERGDYIPRLTVRGDAQLDRPADQMNLQLGVVTQATEAEQAMAENSRLMEAVIAAVERVGITERERQTGRFSVQPQYAPPPRQPQQDWRPKIVGYQVTNTIRIKTQKLEIAGEVIQAATEAGANSVDSVHFDLANHRKHRAEAIEEATHNAMADGEALARASRQRLVRVLSVNLDDASAPEPMYRHEAMRGMAMDMATAPPISPGDITVRAAVTIVYEIAPMN